jgi:hypothetical protein
MAIGSMTGGAKIFSADVTASRTARDGFGAFRREWEGQTGEVWPLAGLDIAASSDFRISVQSVRLNDVSVSDVYSASYVGRTTADHDGGEQVLIHLMRRGSWRFARPDERGEDVTVPAGSFIVRHDGPPALFDVAPRAMAKILILPAPVLSPLLGGRHQFADSSHFIRAFKARYGQTPAEFARAAPKQAGARTHP